MLDRKGGEDNSGAHLAKPVGHPQPFDVSFERHGLQPARSDRTASDGIGDAILPWSTTRIPCMTSGCKNNDEDDGYRQYVTTPATAVANFEASIGHQSPQLCNADNG
jgi:hypothetical protein